MNGTKDDENPKPEIARGPAQETPPPAVQIAVNPQLGICECGSVSFSLVSEMKSEEVPGIRVSRMYECTACGSYRLEK